MVLIFNVYLTDSSGNPYSGITRGILPSYNKLEITKYSLASLAIAYPWTKAIINVELDSRLYTEQDKEELRAFVEGEFEGIEVLYSNKRVVYQQEWKELYKEINADLVLLLCNHDHIFLDSNRECLESIVSQEHSKYTTIVMSHWPENIRWAKSGYIELNETTPRQLNKDYSILDYGLTYKGICIDSLNIITKDLYYDWFFTGDWTEVPLPRVDGISGLYPSIINIRKQLNIPLPEQTVVIPFKEQMRHFDGYMHQRIDNNICPSLIIPESFFESKIKVRYGYEDRKEEWVNLNPKAENYRAADLDGVEDKITLADLPLMWQNRVALLDHNPYIIEEEAIQYRLKAVLEQIYSDSRYNPYIEPEVEERVLNEYLKAYKNYKIA
jgi:hypothetical protein